MPNKVKKLDGSTRMLRPVTRKTRAKTKATVALIRAVAKKVVGDQLENKYETRLSQTSGYPRIYDCQITSNDIYPLMPAISQGVASNERTGDKIRPKKMRVDFTLTTNNADTSSLNAQVRLLVLTDKTIKNSLELPPIVGTQPGSPVGTELLQYGGVVAGYTALPSDDMARVNTERYSVIKDIHKELIKGAGTGPLPANSFIGTQTFVTGLSTHKFSVIIPTPAVLKYSQATDTFPTNFAPFFVLGYVQPDGNAGPSNLLQRVVLGYVVHFDYEDA